MLNPKARESLRMVNSVSERNLVEEFDSNPVTTVIVMCSPTNVAQVEEPVSFYEKLGEVIGEMLAHSFLAMLGISTPESDRRMRNTPITRKQTTMENSLLTSWTNTIFWLLSLYSGKSRDISSSHELQKQHTVEVRNRFDVFEVEEDANEKYQRFVEAKRQAMETCVTNKERKKCTSFLKYPEIVKAWENLTSRYAEAWTVNNEITG